MSEKTGISSWMWFVVIFSVTIAVFLILRPESRNQNHPAPAPPTPKTERGPTTPPVASKHFQFQPTSATRSLQILTYTHFTVGYEAKRKNPAWVVYELDGPDAFHGAAPDRPIFAAEPRLPVQVTHNDYTNSGYDRGHLCPAHAEYSRFGPDAFRETFTVANIIPQPHAINAGIWEDLEDNISGDTNDDGWAASLRNLVVINGPIYDNDPQYLKSGIEIPDECFSIVLDFQEQAGRYKALAFIFPNKGKPTAPLKNWLTSIRHIERKTDLDILAGMQIDQREAIEEAQASEVWAENGN